MSNEMQNKTKITEQVGEAIPSAIDGAIEKTSEATCLPRLVVKLIQEGSLTPEEVANMENFYDINTALSYPMIPPKNYYKNN